MEPGFAEACRNFKYFGRKIIIPGKIRYDYRTDSPSLVSATLYFDKMTVDGRVKGPFDSQEVPEFRASGTTRDEIKSKAEQHIRNCGDEIIRLLRSEKRIILNNGRR